MLCGFHGTLPVDSPNYSHAVRAALGHESFKTTTQSYAQRDGMESAQQKRVLSVAGNRRSIRLSSRRLSEDPRPAPMATARSRQKLVPELVPDHFYRRPGLA